MLNAYRLNLVIALLGLTREQFAHEAGICYITLCRVLSGNPYTKTTRRKIMEIIQNKGIKFVKKGGRVGITMRGSNEKS